MAASGTAFRFAWNSTDWDLSNVDIFHTFTESNDVYGLAAKALGRKFFILERNSDTTKEEFISFIKSHIDEGYPGIIGPPEPCIITGYKKMVRSFSAGISSKPPPNLVEAYDGWINALSDEKSFAISDNYSILFEKVLCRIDAMNCLQDGRNSAAAIFCSLAASDVNRSETYRKYDLRALFF